MCHKMKLKKAFILTPFNQSFIHSSRPYTMNQEVILITGAASGIGRHFALSNQWEYRLAVADIQNDKLGSIFGEETDMLLPLSLDVRSAENWRKAIAAAQNKFGRIDYLINVAGVSLPRFITDASPEYIDKHIDINTKGVLHGTTQMAQLMEEQGHGHIINIASLAGIAPVPGMSYYTASKFAVRGFSLAAALELREKNIFVTTICPDLVKTPMFDHQLTLPEEAALSFSGSTRVLSVADVELAIKKAMRKKPMEITLPASRGTLAKIGGAITGLSRLLYHNLYRKGLKNAEIFKGQ